MESENERHSLVERLKERAAVARSEGTGTALGDALHFEESAAEIERLTRERDEAREALQRRADELNVLQGSIAAYQSGKIEAEREAAVAALATARGQALEQAAAYIEGKGGVIPGARVFARLVSRNNMPCMSGDPRDRLNRLDRRAFDDAMAALADAVRSLPPAMESETAMQHVNHRASDEIATLRAEIERLTRELNDEREWQATHKSYLAQAEADVDKLCAEREAAVAALATARECHEKALRQAFLFGCSVWNGASNAEEAARDREIEEQAWQEFRADGK